MKIILTGGHLTPSYAFGSHARLQGDQLWYISSPDSQSLEAIQISKLDISYIQIPSVKFDRYHPAASLLKLPSLAPAIYQNLRLLQQVKPDVVVTFGSYNGLATAIAASITRIPVVLHEQTRTLGLANRMIARFSDVCVGSYPETAKHFPSSCNLHIIGNILRDDIWHPPARLSIPLATDKPILFVTGGNQGSAVINTVVMNLIVPLALRYQLVWQVGNWLLPAEVTLPDSVHLASWYSAADTSWLLHHAHMVICRGGANTTAELMVGGVPSIIIPLPKSSADEQTVNAQFIASKQAGLVLPQPNLTPETLHTAMDAIETRYSDFKASATAMKQYQNPNAVREFYQLVSNVVEDHDS